MSLEVFRRHQKKLLAVLALFAMVAFSLDFSLLRRTGFGRGGADNDPVVVPSLFGRKIHKTDLLPMMSQRSRANRFMAQLVGAPDMAFFGGLDERSMVDALILQHEADRLGLPTDSRLAIDWLQRLTNNGISTETFDAIYRRTFAEEVTDTQLLDDIANQVRLSQVRSLPGASNITPLDVFRAYKEQYQQVSARVVGFGADQYLDRVGPPSAAELEAYYNQYKNAEPDPHRDTPGFKQPRRVTIESVSADPAELAQKIEPLLTDEDLRAVLAARPADFPPSTPELPEGVFAGEPALTPSLRDTFRELRPQLAARVARERAEAIVGLALDTLVRKVIEPFTDKYLLAIEAEEEKQGGAAKPGERRPLPPGLPEPGDALEKAVAAINSDPAKEIDFGDDAALRDLVAKVPVSLAYEKTPPLDRESASSYGRIGGATRGGSELEPGVSFTDVFFGDRRGNYEEVELGDPAGRRYLAWKVADQDAYIPKLDEIRDQVSRAFRMEKARELAKRAAEAFAGRVRQAGGDVAKAAQAENLSVVTTTPVPQMQPGGFLGGSFQAAPARPSQIAQLPDAGDELRKALFSLEPAEVKIAPNASKSIYYVLGLAQSTPASVQALYSTFGPSTMLRNEVETEASRKRLEGWMAQLRTNAGLPADWVPPEEAAKSKSESAAG